MMDAIARRVNKIAIGTERKCPFNFLERHKFNMSSNCHVELKFTMVQEIQYPVKDSIMYWDCDMIT